MMAYRRAFLLALIGNIALILLLAGLWQRYRSREPETRTKTPSANATAEVAIEPATGAAPSSAEVSLAPMQISAQRLQSIGVKTGQVERKQLQDEIRTTGTIAVDETKLAYVQVRFSGFIEKVFVDATYQYVRKGQPLFTIYSPDVVATEREYLVARQNQKMMSESTVPGVASSAASLLDAATERLKQWGVSQQEIARLESTGQV